MDRTFHDIRNDLAIAVGSVQAFIDGKLEPDEENLGDVLQALADIDEKLTAIRSSRQAGAPAKENLFNRVVEAAPNAMILVDERGRITLVNTQAERLFGYTRSELLGLSIETIVPERFRRGHSGLRESFNEAPVARPMGAGRDLYGRRKDGSEVPIEIALNPMKTDDAHLVLAAIVDITERKRGEELRLAHVGMQQHAAELEELNRELGNASRFKTEFVSTMSHELRTPLTAIIGAAELLNRSKLDERDRISVETINEAAEGLFALINSILDFSKIEAGKMDLHAARFEIESVLEGAAEIVAQLAIEKGITLYAYVDPAIPPVLGDGARLRQILLNLLGNAVKFTESGHVAVSAMPLVTAGDEIVVRFEVADTGIGIAPEMLPLLFEPFSQADRSASRRFAGTGLGLSISKRLVELMGGEIGVTSQPGSGSLFWFTAPFEPAAVATPAPRRLLEGTGGLIVCGDDFLAQIIERYLESWTMQSRRVTTRDGIIETLRADDRTRWVAIIDLDDDGLSGIGITVDMMRAMLPSRVIGIGGSGALRKPVRKSHLFEEIVRAFAVALPEVPSSSTPAAVTAPPLSGPVLIAEDNARLQRLLKLQFDELGVPVTFVSDGLQAVEALRTTRYSLVFMDCQMPNMDGLTATKVIREQERGGGVHVPIAAMTANAFAEDRVACAAAGMDDYLAKPVRLSDLRAVIARWSSAKMKT